MSREEFLQGLQETLSGEVPPQTVRENLKYYDDYIRAETGRGRPEKEVMEELGSPRLIARTIIDTTPGAGDGAYEEYRTAGGYTREKESDAGTENVSGFGGRSGNIHYYDLNKWYWKLLAVLVPILIIAVVLMIIGGILSLVIPLLPIFILIGLVMYFFKGWTEF